MNEELSDEDKARLKKYNGRYREAGEGGLSWSSYDQAWIGSVELPKNPATGKRQRKKVKSKDYNEALRRLQELRKEVAKGNIVSTTRRGRGSLAEWLTYWVEEIAKPNISPNTLRSYRNTIDRHIIPAIGAVKIDKMTAMHVREMQKQIMARSTSRSTRSAILAHAVLSKALNDARVEGHVTENVAALVPRLKSNPKNRGALTMDQALALLRNCVEREDRMTTRIAAALMTGARQGELLGLEWDRVDLDAGEIDLSWQLQSLRQIHGCGDTCGRKRASACPDRQFEVPPGFEYRQLHGALCLTRPKTAGSRRKVPLTPQLWEVLRAHRAMTEDEPNPYGLVWTTPEGNPINPRNDADHWKRVLELAGLDHVPLHAARHTTASLLLEAGVDMHIIMQVLGHSVMLTTQGYAHVPQELARKSIASLGGMLELGTQGKSAA